MSGKQQSKDKAKKTRSTKIIYRYTSREVARLTGVSISYVKKIRAGLVDTTSPKAQQVMLVDDILYDGSTKLLQEVERILNKQS